MRKIRKFRKIAVSFLTAVLLLTALTAAGTVIPSKKDAAEDDLLPPSRTLKYKTYLGVFLCPERVRLIQS